MRVLFILFLLTIFVQAQNSWMLDYARASSEYCSATFTTDNSTDGFYSAWVQFDELSNAHVIIAIQDDASSSVFLRMQQIGTNVTFFQRNGDTQDYMTATTTTLVINTPYHIVAGSDGSQFLIWVNGIAQSITVSGGANNGDWLDNLTAEDRLTIGTLYNAGTPFNSMEGKIDEVAYFNVTPTQAMVNDIYNGGTPKDISGMTGLVHYYRFEEGTGTSSVDSKGSANLTLVNTPTWLASIFGWGEEFLGFKTHKSFSKFKGF